MIGADVQALRSLADLLDGGSANIERATAQLHAAVTSGSWIGQDADRFRADWHSHHHPALRRVGEALRTAGEVARRQADEQEEASASSSGAAIPRAPMPHPQDLRPTEKGAPPGSEKGGPPWAVGGMGADGPDPGKDVQYPKGVDPNSDLAKTMASTPRGRRILQWMHDNDVDVKIDPSQKGAWYQNGILWISPSVTLGGGYDQAAVLVHEANHAYFDKTGHRPNYWGDKGDYVNGLIDEETEGVWLDVVAAKEFRAAGHNVPPASGEDMYDAAYAKAYSDALASGATQADAEAAADRAGRQEIRSAFDDGRFKASTNGGTYADNYGDDWKLGCLVHPFRSGCWS